MRASSHVLLVIGLCCVTSPIAAQSQADSQSPAKQITVQQITGTVFLPDGKPAAGAKVALMANVRTGTDIESLREKSVLVAQAEVKKEGRFELRFDQLPDGEINAVFILAAAAGYGLAWTRPNFDDWPQDYELSLPPEAKLRGKLLQPDGHPAAGLPLRISLSKGHPLWSFFLGDNVADMKEFFATEFTSDELGQLKIDRLPTNTQVNFRGSENMPTSIHWNWKSDATDATFTLPETFAISGTVTAADTELPIAAATVTHLGVQAETDADGNFRLPGADAFSGPFQLTVQPKFESPYVAWHGFFQRHRGNPEEKVQLKLDRGVLVSGEVLEEGSGQPVPHAYVWAETRTDPKTFGSIGMATAITDAGGKFSFVAKPGTIDVSVETCSCDFVMRPVQIEHRASPTKSVFAPENVFAHATVEVPAGASGEVRLVVGRGFTVRGEIVGSNGKTPTLVSMRHPYPQYGGFTDNYRFNILSTHGHFAVHGVPLDGEIPALFLDAASNEGKYEQVPGLDAGQLKKVTLEKCGSATVRFIDSDGKAIAGKQQTVFIAFSDQTKPEVGIKPEEAILPFSFANWEIDLEKFQNQATDDEGRLKLTHLIPGVTYLVRTGNPGPSVWETLLIRVGPGQHVDVPDVVVQPRPAPRAAVPAAKARPAEKANKK